MTIPFFLLLAASACRRDETIEIVADADWSPTLAAALSTVHDDRITVVTDPEPDLGKHALGLSVVRGSFDSPETFRVLPGADRTATVEASDLLGAQMGVAQALEQLGYRFYHPHDTHLPDDLDPDAFGDSEVVVPDMRRRGLHLHTLHPTDAMLDFWAGGSDAKGHAEEVIDWVVRNRGNHLQWVALDDIQSDEDRLAAWRLDTAGLLDVAHDRGLTVGLGIQLFGSGDLQNAYHLIDDVSDSATMEAEVREGLHTVLDETPFDLLNLSFGEFFGEDPKTFVDVVSLVSRVVATDFPGVELTAVIHVGNYDELRVKWNGEEMLYYFLAAYADPAPHLWVHTVMYYDLFEDTGGAYLHDSFDEHEAFLVDRLNQGQPVAYFPESAYWVAFDNDVPVYLPLYIGSRWTDLASLRQVAQAPLEEHVTFSSGWEWGYWQNDVAALRMAHTLPSSTQDFYEELFSPLPSGAEVASLVDRLAGVQHDALIDERLAAYFAGRDAVIDLGDSLGIVSQPDRPSFEEIGAMSSEERDAFRTSTLGPLSTFADDLEALDRDAAALDDGGDRFVAEIRDGFAIDALRARFAATVFTGATDHADGLATDAVADAASLVVQARDVVARRHAAFHDPDPARLTSESANATLYPYGYLHYADDLCFWEREQAQLENFVTGSSTSVPPCIE